MHHTTFNWYFYIRLLSVYLIVIMDYRYFFPNDISAL